MPTLALPAAERPGVESLRLSALNPGGRVEVEVVPPAPPAEGQEGENRQEYTLRGLPAAAGEQPPLVEIRAVRITPLTHDQGGPHVVRTTSGTP